MVIGANGRRVVRHVEIQPNLELVLSIEQKLMEESHAMEIQLITKIARLGAALLIVN